MLQLWVIKLLVTIDIKDSTYLDMFYLYFKQGLAMEMKLKGRFMIFLKFDLDVGLILVTTVACLLVVTCIVHFNK